MYSGSISVNRITVGLPPDVRAELFEEARSHGIKVPELIRHILLSRSAKRRGDIADLLPE